MIGQYRVKTSHLLLAILVAASTAVASGQSTYTPTRAVPREHAAYVLPDGTVQIVTAAKLAGTIAALNQLFIATHPGVKFALLQGDNYSAMAALTFDRSALAPLGCDYTRIGLGDNLKIAAEPLGFRIAHASLAPGNVVPSLGVIVNPRNPLVTLTMTQLTRMFTIGAPGGDIATWAQAGVSGPLADRAVRPIGPMATDYTDSEDPQVGEFLSTDKMAGLNMNHSYVALAGYTDIVQRVKEDPAAIGITALNVPLSDVKILGLGSDTGSPSQGSTADIGAGRYPLDRFVYIYIRIGKGTPIDAFAKEYMRMVLSVEGQRIIAKDAAGYIPLSSAELAEERAKLDR